MNTIFFAAILALATSKAQAESYFPYMRSTRPYISTSFVSSTEKTDNTYSYFVIVSDMKVIGRYFELEDAKAKLMKYPPSAPTPSRMIAEVIDGVVNPDPHTVGGENQDSGINAGFNKRWTGRSDIHRMTRVAQKFVIKEPVWFVLVEHPSKFGVYANIEDAKVDLMTYPLGAPPPSRMIAEVFGKVVQRDPHTVGGQNQRGGVNAGFNKWWNGWSDIHRMTKEAQTFVDGEHSMFAVVANKAVVGYYPCVEDAKERLLEYPSGASSPSRMVSEVINGVVQKDPHTVGGQNQRGGVNAGFNKWWNGWSDIHRMTAIVEKFIA